MRVITLNEDDMREPCDHNDLATCGHCNRSWCFTCNPTPSARCPFEYEHEYDEPTDADDEDQDFAAFLANNNIKIDPNAPLAPHGGCNWSGCTTCFPPKEDQTYRDDADDEIRFPRKPQANGPCPVCGESNGFHNDDMHRINIPADKLLEKGWHHG